MAAQKKLVTLQQCLAIANDLLWLAPGVSQTQQVCCFATSWAMVKMASALPSFNALFSVAPSPSRQHRSLQVLRLRRQAGRLDQCLAAADTPPCCRQCCLEQFKPPAVRSQVKTWHDSWRKLSKAQRQDTLLRYMREHVVTKEPAELLEPVEPVEPLGPVVPAEPGVPVEPGMLMAPVNQQRRARHTFLERAVCRRAWCKLTLVSCRQLQRATALSSAGILQWPKHTRRQPSHVQDAMHGALATLVSHVRERMPLKRVDLDGVHMPFAHKMQLFRLLKAWYQSSISLAKEQSLRTSVKPIELQEPLEPVAPAVALPPSRGVLLPRPPSYKTFIAVLRRTEFRKLRFHRVVKIGRCAKCSFFNWKCLTAGPAARANWERLAAAHQWLQLSQKRRYAEDRCQAAMDYPHGELYLAMDGGSGSDFVLPHLSPNDLEGPNKALQGFHSLPCKVMNGLVHGDQRSHVFLSPGCVVGVSLLGRN